MNAKKIGWGFNYFCNSGNELNFSSSFSCQWIAFFSINLFTVCNRTSNRVWERTADDAKLCNWPAWKHLWVKCKVYSFWGRERERTLHEYTASGAEPDCSLSLHDTPSCSAGTVLMCLSVKVTFKIRAALGSVY